MSCHVTHVSNHRNQPQISSTPAPSVPLPTGPRTFQSYRRSWRTIDWVGSGRYKQASWDYANAPSKMIQRTGIIWFFHQVWPCLTLSQDNDTWGVNIQESCQTSHKGGARHPSQPPNPRAQSPVVLWSLSAVSLSLGVEVWTPDQLSLRFYMLPLTTHLKTILKIIWQSDAIGNHGNHYFVIDIWCRFVNVLSYTYLRRVNTTFQYLRFYVTRLQSLWIETRHESNGKEWEKRLKELRHNQSRYV